jgi:hypothetical protein
MGRRVKDGGGSEGRPVMRRIEIEPFIRRHCPTRKRADIMPFGRAQRVEVSEDALSVELVDGRVVIVPPSLGIHDCGVGRLKSDLGLRS